MDVSESKFPTRGEAELDREEVAVAGGSTAGEQLFAQLVVAIILGIEPGRLEQIGEIGAHASGG